MKSIIVIGSFVLILLNGCTGTTPQPVVKSESFMLGHKDGCATATGEYTKNSDAFRTDKAYYEGWFDGRKNCNPTQAK